MGQRLVKRNTHTKKNITQLEITGWIFLSWWVLQRDLSLPKGKTCKIAGFVSKDQHFLFQQKRGCNAKVCGFLCFFLIRAGTSNIMIRFKTMRMNASCWKKHNKSQVNSSKNHVTKTILIHRFPATSKHNYYYI